MAKLVVSQGVQSLSITAAILLVTAASVTAGGLLSPVLFEWTPASSSSLVNSPGSLLNYWNPAPGLVFNDTKVTMDSTGATFASNPHKATIPPGESGTLDHAKFLALSRPYSPVMGKKLVYELKLKSKSFIPASLPAPYTRDFVKKPQDDIRLGAFSANFIDFSIMLVVDIFFTNNGIWALYERLPFNRNATYNYAAFTYTKRIGSRQPGQTHTAKIIYNSKKNSIKYVLDGKAKYELTNLGFKPPQSDKAVALVDLGGVEEPIRPSAFVAGFGSFTIIDFADPNQPRNPATGLLKLNTPAGYYKVPTKFATDSNNVGLRLFGQGTVSKVKKMSVYYK